MTPILSVRDLTIRFGNRPVIHHLNFEVNPDDNLAIIGPNGAGKSVLLRALLNLLPYEGVIQWAPDAKLGYVPQKIAADRHLPLQVNDLLVTCRRENVITDTVARVGVFPTNRLGVGGVGVNVAA